MGDRVAKRSNGHVGQVVELVLGEVPDGDGGTADGVALYRVTYDDQRASRYEELPARDLVAAPGGAVEGSTIRVTRGAKLSRANWKLVG